MLLSRDRSRDVSYRREQTSISDPLLFRRSRVGSFNALSSRENISVGGDYRNHTARAQEESFAARLFHRIRGFFSDLGLILIHQCILAHAATHYTLEKSLRFDQRRIGFAVMPVNDLKRKFTGQFKVYIFSMQVKHVARETLCGLDGFAVEDQTKDFVFVIAHEPSLGMLHRIKDSINACGTGGFDEEPRCLGDGFESSHHRARMMTQMFKQDLIAREVLCLGKRAK